MKKTANQPVPGFTLIETAIVMLILGLLIAPMAVLYGNYIERQKMATSYENIYQAVDALQNFRRMNGFYPCPAPMNVDRSDVDYGRAVSCRAAPFSAQAPGSCTDGICIENSVRSAALAAQTPPVSGRVIVGAVPFRDLQVDEDSTYDAHGGRLYYAITESMTDIATLGDGNGAIAVRNAAGSPMIDPDGSAAYVVFHAGANQRGAYTRDGALVEPCAGAGLDVENCNDGFSSGTGPSTDAVYIASPRNDAAGANFFDDEILYFSQISDPTWKRTVPDPENIEELSPQFVGVGTAGPTEDFDVRSAGTGVDSLYVNGPTGTAGQGGLLYTGSICDPSGTHCFSPALIAGDANAMPPTGGMKCAPGTYMSGIENGAPACDEIAILCPASTPVLVGFNGAGQPNCVAAPGASCPADTRTVCSSNDVAIPASPDTTITATYNVGACRSISYRCNAGAWVVNGSSGQCTFTPTTTTNSGIACGPGYTGTYTTTTTTTCTGGTTSGSTFATDCTCVGGTTIETNACSVVSGPGFTGTASRTITYSPPSCAASAGPWTGCTCAPGSTDSRACSHPDVGLGTGWIGTATRTITYSGATCSPVYGSWNTAGCTCDTTPVITYADHACTNPVCEEPNPSDRDQFTATINPATCTQNPATQTHVGSCRPKAFKWIDIGAGQGSGDTGERVIAGDCSCAQHTQTISNWMTCNYATDPTKALYKCRCQ